LKNWFYHLIAGLTGNGFSQGLAQDFWAEPLFELPMVRHHFWKLLWVFSMSSILQMVLPAALIATVFALYTTSSWSFALTILGGVTVLALVLALLFAVGAWVGLKRQASRMRRSGPPESKEQ
jgi:hypothetical protein